MDEAKGQILAGDWRFTLPSGASYVVNFGPENEAVITFPEHTPPPPDYFVRALSKEAAACRPTS